MTALSTYALGLGTFVSAIIAFYTGTLGVIFDMMWVNPYALIFVVGFLSFLIVPLWQFVSSKKIMDVHGRKFFVCAIVALLIVPFVVQGQYNPSQMVAYQDSQMTSNTEMLTYLYYYNTSGNYLNAEMTETIGEDGAWTTTWASTSQDNTKGAAITVRVSASSLWNITAFDQDTTDHIVAIGFRVGGDNSPTSGLVKMGFELSGYSDMFLNYAPYWTRGTADDLVMYYLTQDDYDTIDDSGSLLSSVRFQLEIRELDANCFTNDEELEFQLVFYSSTSMSTFNEYLLYSGIILFLVAAAITKYWNPTGKTRSRNGRRKWRTRRYSYPKFKRRRRSFRRRRY